MELSISPSNEYSRLICFRIDWLDLLAVQGTLKSLLQHRSSKALIHLLYDVVKFTSVPSLRHVRLFATTWTAALQASLSITKSWSLLKLMSIELVMPSNHLILCHPLLLLSSIFPSIRVFSSEWALHVRWPECWSFSLSISPSNEYSGLISFRINWFDLVFKKKSFIWLHLVLVAAHKIFSCGI